MESDLDEDDGNQIMQEVPVAKSTYTPKDDEESDASHRQPEGGDDEEEISEQDEELMSLDPKGIKSKIVAEVC